MKKNTIIILLACLVLILGLGIWAMYFFKCPSECPKTVNKSVPTGYQVYNNTKYGVSFEYPRRLLLNSFDERSANMGDETGFWQIIFYADPAPTSLDDWLKENSANYTKVEDITLGGQKAEKLLETGPGEVTNKEYALVSLKGDYFYRILYRYLSDDELAHLIESFRFTK